MGVNTYKLEKIEIRNGWLFPDDRVSYSNASIINTSKITHINYYQNKVFDDMPVEKSKGYYITFGNDVERWWYKNEDTAKELYNDIFEILYSGNTPMDVNLKETNEKRKENN